MGRELTGLLAGHEGIYLTLPLAEQQPATATLITRPQQPVCPSVLQAAGRGPVRSAAPSRVAAAQRKNGGTP